MGQVDCSEDRNAFAGFSGHVAAFAGFSIYVAAFTGFSGHEATFADFSEHGAAFAGFRGHWAAFASFILRLLSPALPFLKSIYVCLASICLVIPERDRKTVPALPPVAVEIVTHVVRTKRLQFYTDDIDCPAV
jgi:hypothetical protein